MTNRVKRTGSPHRYTFGQHKPGDVFRVGDRYYMRTRGYRNAMDLHEGHVVSFKDSREVEAVTLLGYGVHIAYSSNPDLLPEAREGDDGGE